MLSIFPHTYHGKNYYSLKQIAGAMDISSAVLYQALENVKLPRFMVEEQVIRRGRSRVKMIPSELALPMCEQFSKVSPKPISSKEIIKTLKEICSLYIKKTDSFVQPIHEKVNNLAKRIFTVLE